MQRVEPTWRRLTPAAVFFWIASLVSAQAPPGGVIPAAVWDASANLSPPTWFGPVQTAAGARMTVWRATLRPPPGPSRLAVTLIFDESQGGFARLIWQGPGRSVTLCGNLYEGVASLHARTLLLDRETLGGPGQLVLEATGSRPVLARAELAWVEPLVLAATGWNPAGFYLAPSGKIYPADELQGSGRRFPQDERRGQIVDAVLDAGPVKVAPDTPVRFVAPLTKVPAFARLEAQVAGLTPQEEPILSVNGRPLAAVAVSLPGLEDAGYRWLAADARLHYGGWRTVTAHVPAGWLQAGENQLDWQCPLGSGGMTIRHLRLQASYDRTAPPLVSPPAVPPAPAAVSVSPAKAPVTLGTPPPAPRLRLGLSSGAGAVGLRPE